MTAYTSKLILCASLAAAGCTPLAGGRPDAGSGGGGGGSVQDATPGETDVDPPRIQVASPDDGDELPAGDIAIVVSANDDVGVTEVDIFINDESVGMATQSSGFPQNGTWEYPWTATAGTYRVKAIARDASGKSATDDDTEVTVTAGGDDPPDDPPDDPGETYEPIDWQLVGGSFAGLNMYVHVPPGMGVDHEYPLLVVLHGCWEDAEVRSTNTEWNKLADTYKFYVVHAENAFQIQQCFDWYSATSQSGGGEAAGIIAMIDTMKDSYGIDPDRVFLDGFSAGGGLAVILLADYPELFAGAAINAGMPFRGYTGTDVGTLGYIFSEHDRTPAEWAALMPNNPGTYPPIIAFYGTADTTVHYTYTRELVEQWTEVQGVDQEPDNGGSLLKPGNTGHTYDEYRDTDGNVVIATVALAGMSHGYAVDPNGEGEDAGGTTSAALMGKPSYAKDVGLYAAYYSARFFGID